MASSNPCATGYGPSANRIFRILFDGDERKFSLWETKFLGFMRVRNLHSVFKDLSNQDTPVDANKNEEAYAELVQVLDDRSLSLIIRDARDDGGKALQILRNHYRPTGKPRVITLYTELTSLIKLKHESITDYIIRAETSAASLRDAGEKVSDSLLISMNSERFSDSDDHFTFHISDSAYECDSATSDCDEAAKLLVDSGASCHIITDKDKFVNFDNSFKASSHVLELADGSRNNSLVHGQGNAVIKVKNSKGHLYTLTLKDALYVPSFSQDIFSVRAATKKGATIIFHQNTGKLIPPGSSASVKIQQEGKLFFIKGVAAASTTKRTLEQWHNVMGHCNREDLLKLESKVEGMEITDRSSKFQCHVCPQEKLSNTRSRVPDTTARKPFDLVHIDLSGSIEPESLDGHKYSLVCVDSFSNLTFVYFLKSKGDAHEARSLRAISC
ncbi:CCHC-type Zinc finger, nucleic acid binding protein a [Plakobranchus ocellatus]|uniref:CCHC-type Zinc finger, nucleic acid binding protein a n=1 Tax=Plakobranchus ocellatus TaxID=259542 RepID=A0AAV4A4Q4_9GAST|nr:CCHC-type Zinc finger, nucleic acid binding protein a [Plakobranchus ocellatus]